MRDKKIDLVPDGRKYLIRQYGEYKFVHIKVKHYKGNGLDRMLSISQFAFRLYKYRRHFSKPDIILHNIHAPFDYPVYWCAKKFKVPYIAEAWDLWPDGFVRFGLISPKNPLVPMAYAVERKMYENADRIIFSFAGGIDYLKGRKWDKANGGKIDLSKVYYINNGINIDEFEENKKKYVIDDKDLKDTELFKVVYLGSVKLANNLKRLIDAAALLKQYSRFRFLIYGDGSDREYLKQYCKENSITNVIFKEKSIPFQYVPYVVSQSNLNIMNYEKNFGIYGISSGKFFMYLAAGKPILCNVKISYCEIEKYNLGIAKNLEAPQEYADEIMRLGNMNTADYNAMCHRVKEIAKGYDYKIISGKLLSVLNLLRTQMASV
jgi:glycosyltransferase involved in cell wall biosynthesis